MVSETFKRMNNPSIVPRDLNNGRIIHGFAMKRGVNQCGDHDGTLRLLDRLLGAGTQLDLVIVTIVLLACSHLAILMHGKEIHGYMIVSGLGRMVLLQTRVQYQVTFKTLPCCVFT
ncbi:hypothetical protein AAG906_022320 [Vitis piasezkii]